MPVHYPADDSDNARWERFQYRPGDIVISTRSKSGTTWMQMICALLVFQTSELPRPLWELSPWLDWLVTPADEMLAQLEAQTHRRFIKTHTPLNGLPLSPLATYIVVARHPLDAAVSLYHHGNNLDREQLRRFTGQPSTVSASERPPLQQWVRQWVEWDGRAEEELDSLPGFMLHLADAWARRHQPNVILVHFEDLLSDLEAEMRRLAELLAIEVPSRRWGVLVEAARFESMRAKSSEVAPATAGILKDPEQFFRLGTSGESRDALDPDDIARYYERVTRVAPADLLEWLHRDQGSVPPRPVPT